MKKIDTSKMDAVRVQLSRRKGWRMPPNTVNVARPHRWGNPHHIGLCPVCGVEHTRAEAVAELRAEIECDPMLTARLREELAGKNLACWCKLGEPCHADMLINNTRHRRRGGCRIGTGPATQSEDRDRHVLEIRPAALGARDRKRKEEIIRTEVIIK